MTKARLKVLLHNTMSMICDLSPDPMEALDTFREAGFTYKELQKFDFGDLLDEYDYCESDFDEDENEWGDDEDEDY